MDLCASLPGNGLGDRISSKWVCGAGGPGESSLGDRRGLSSSLSTVPAALTNPTPQVIPHEAGGGDVRTNTGRAPVIARAGPALASGLQLARSA